MAKRQCTRACAQDAVLVATAARRNSEAGWEDGEVGNEGVRKRFFFFFLFFATLRRVQQVEAPSTGTVELPLG